jgi:enoyl-[acyl-carrier protein] reductase I
VQNDDEIASSSISSRKMGRSRRLVHSIAFAPSEALEGDFLDGLSREAFRISQEVSAYSFPPSPRPPGR